MQHPVFRRREVKIVISTSPKASVVMSAYNSSGQIERAIASILDQSFSDFELIILNDGSNDDTEEKILSFSDTRIRYFSLDHAGLPTALNYGVSVADSEIIIRHDSDDWSEPDRFALQMQSLENDSELVLVASWHNVVDGNGEYLGLKTTALDDAALKMMLRRRSPFCHGAVAIRKSALEKMGGYNESLYYSQDYDLWLRMAAEGMKFSCIPQPLYNYSITPESIVKGWHKLGYSKTIRQNALRPDGQQSYVVKEAPEFGKRYTESLWYYAVGSMALEDGRRGRAFKYFARSLYKNPLFWRSAARMMLTIMPSSLANALATGAKKRLESKREN